MKKLLLAALIALTTPTVAGRPDPAPLKGSVHVVSKFAKRETARFVKDIADARKYVLRYGADVAPERATLLARTIVTKARAHGFGWRIFAAVLAQESRFRPDLCTKRQDMGVGQVNWPTWGEYLRLDRARLIHDDTYNLSVAADIFGSIHRKYASTDVFWWSRYHDAREDRRVVYQEMVVARL